MTEKKTDYLCIPVLVMVDIGPDSAEAWPEERCHQKALDVWHDVGVDFGVSNQEPNWWVQS